MRRREAGGGRGPMTCLLLKRPSASRPSGEWNRRRPYHEGSRGPRAASGHVAAAPPRSVMNSSLQDGAENAMSLRIGYLLPTRERITARSYGRYGRTDPESAEST